MNRREFTVGAAWALLGGAAITISGCGGSNPTEASTPLTDVVGTLSANHGHAVIITAAQLSAGGALSLDIRGTSGHTHVVSLTAEDVAAIRSRMVVQRDATGGSHVHTVTFNA